jgi:hypothetical protein
MKRHFIAGKTDRPPVTHHGIGTVLGVMPAVEAGGAGQPQRFYRTVQQ